MVSTARFTLAGGVAAALLIGAAPAALLPAAAALPPNCTAADLAGVSAGVAAATSAYLFTHPDVNAFFTGLEGAPQDTLSPQIERYLNDNPQVRGELAAIRQPLVDIKNRCGTDQNLPDESP